MEWYRKASARVEHLKRVDDPLVVRAQQRADVLARRIAQPLRHAGPAPLLAHHLEASFVRHDLKHTGLTNHISYRIGSLYSPTGDTKSIRYLRQAKEIKDAPLDVWDF